MPVLVVVVVEAVVVALILKIGLLARAVYGNWMIAKQLQVPIIISPFTSRSDFCKYIQSILPPSLRYHVQKVLPFTRLFRDNWMFHEKYTICEDFGEVFALVTPDDVEVFVANTEAARQVLTRGRDFPKQIELMTRMNIFGKSLATVEGSDWKRHRRCTASAFSDNVHEAVWTLSSSKAAQVLVNLSSQENIASTRTEMNHLSFSVLMQACMGIKKTQDTKTKQKSEPSIDTAERNLNQLLRIMSTYRPLRLFTLRRPGFLRQKKPNEPNPFHESLKGLNLFFNNLIEDCKTRPQSGHNLLSSMIPSRNTKLISDDEIKGNLFLLMFAGHETTANTLLYIIYLLGIFPQWQEWAIEELDQIFSDIPQHATPTMQEIFPRMTRFKAIMYETLRLYGPVLNLLRKTLPNQPQIINMSPESRMLIPGNIKLNVLTLALHTNPNYWGPDALEWNPSRWLNNTTDLSNHPEEIDQKKIDHLFAWAEGPRACPGRKFSQFEILAVLMTLFRQTTVQLDPRLGMSANEARIEALQVVEQSKVRLTLQMDNPDLVRLRWVSR